jgi:hypothetical protein
MPNWLLLPRFTKQADSRLQEHTGNTITSILAQDAHSISFDVCVVPRFDRAMVHHSRVLCSHFNPVQNIQRPSRRQFATLAVYQHGSFCLPVGSLWMAGSAALDLHVQRGRPGSWNLLHGRLCPTCSIFESDAARIRSNSFARAIDDCIQHLALFICDVAADERALDRSGCRLVLPRHVCVAVGRPQDRIGYTVGREHSAPVYAGIHVELLCMGHSRSL